VYSFAGFFAKPPVRRPDVPIEGAVWRDITTPFVGVGVRLAALLDHKPDPVRVEALAGQLGIDRATDWLFLDYVCWGGRIDFVYGLGVRGGRRFGPAEEPDEPQATETYVSLMREFGVERADAMMFPPFERGFWGET
jgi:hypothetical protein